MQHDKRIGSEADDSTLYPLRRHWHGSDPFKTHFFNAFSIMLPGGEQFFIDSIKLGIQQQNSDHLTHQAEMFIRQEANHRKMHIAYNQTLARLGYRVEALEQQVENWLVIGYRRHSIKTRLAYVTVNEHFTSIFSHALLTHPSWLKGADSHYAKLWRWHAREELEHHAIAYDIYRANGGGYFRRVLMMLIMTPVLFYEVTYNLFSFLRTDRKLLNLWLHVKGFCFLWIYPGIITRTIPAYLRFYLPWFKPDSKRYSKVIEKLQQYAHHPDNSG